MDAVLAWLGSVADCGAPRKSGWQQFDVWLAPTKSISFQRQARGSDEGQCDVKTCSLSIATDGPSEQTMDNLPSRPELPFIKAAAALSSTAKKLVTSTSAATLALETWWNAPLAEVGYPANSDGASQGVLKPLPPMPPPRRHRQLTQPPHSAQPPQATQTAPSPLQPTQQERAPTAFPALLFPSPPSRPPMPAAARVHRPQTVLSQPPDSHALIAVPDSREPEGVRSCDPPGANALLRAESPATAVPKLCAVDLVLSRCESAATDGTLMPHTGESHVSARLARIRSARQHPSPISISSARFALVAAASPQSARDRSTRADSLWAAFANNLSPSTSPEELAKLRAELFALTNSHTMPPSEEYALPYVTPPATRKHVEWNVDLTMDYSEAGDAQPPPAKSPKTKWGRFVSSLRNLSPSHHRAKRSKKSTHSPTGVQPDVVPSPVVTMRKHATPPRRYSLVDEQPSTPMAVEPDGPSAHHVVHRSVELLRV